MTRMSVCLQSPAVLTTFQLTWYEESVHVSTEILQPTDGLVRFHRCFQFYAVKSLSVMHPSVRVM